MKYLVMECHYSYAVVLSEDGRFLQVANMGYQVGQTVAEVWPAQPPAAAPRQKRRGWVYALAAAAACLVLLAASVLQFSRLTYASVYLSINPAVRIDVNRSDKVVGLAGANEDGVRLAEGYVYRHKALPQVLDELVERAIGMGYLHAGGQISLVLDAKSDEWVLAHSQTLAAGLNERLGEGMAVTITVTSPQTPHSGQAVIPAAPAAGSGGAGHAGTDYGDSDYGPAEDDITDYGDSDYGPAEDGVTDYGDSGYGPAEDGASDYGDSSYSDGSPVIVAPPQPDTPYDADEDSDYGASPYGDSAYGGQQGDSDHDDD